MQITIIILTAALAAFLAVKWIYFKILKIAKKKVIVDNPDARKLQKLPVPILGGISVFFGLGTGALAGASAYFILTGSILKSMAPVLCAMIMMLYTGAIDDVVGLTPKTRFIVEILTVLGLVYAGGGCIDSFHGLWGVRTFSWWLAVPLTVFAGVGIINAINMIDGVNGLCSGLCIVCSLIFGCMFVKVGDIPNSVLAFATAAATLPFLFHNVFGKKSRMFLGDAGTMMIGVIMTWFTISILRSDTSLRFIAMAKNANLVAMVLAIMSVPVFDTVRVMSQRIFRGKSPFHPDKIHLHHALVRAGVSHSITSLTELFIDLLIVGGWVFAAKIHLNLDMQLYIVILASVILVWGTYFFLRWQEDHHTEFMHRITKFGIKTHLGHSEKWLKLEGWLDASDEGYDDEAEEYSPSLSLDDMAQAKNDIYDFLKGKSEVFVDDIKKRLDLDKGMVDKVVGEGLEDGGIILIKSWDDGSPSIIALPED